MTPPDLVFVTFKDDFCRPSQSTEIDAIHTLDFGSIAWLGRIEFVQPWRRCKKTGGLWTRYSVRLRTAFHEGILVYFWRRPMKLTLTRIMNIYYILLALFAMQMRNGLEGKGAINPDSASTE